MGFRLTPDNAFRREEKRLKTFRLKPFPKKTLTFNVQPVILYAQGRIKPWSPA